MMNDALSKTFHVPDDLAEETLVAALRRWLPGKSWSHVRGLVLSRRVMVNGNLCLDAGRRLKAQDVVKVLEHSAAAPPSIDDVKIRFLDLHLAVVEKPAGMTTLRHPEERNWPRRRKQLQPTLDETLPRIIERKQHRGPRTRGVPRRLRAVHRLDRETSGLMVFARTVEAESQLGTQFKKHSIHRLYLAVVPGRIEAQTIDTRLVDDRGDGRRGSSRDPKLGKRAVTHVRPVERLDGYTVVECQLETGRTHQIRIHLSEIGHPVCGDKVYRGPYPGTPLVDASGAPRVALHAAELGFDHPLTGEPMQFSMPLPNDLVVLIDRLRGKPAARNRPRGKSRR